MLNRSLATAHDTALRYSVLHEKNTKWQELQNGIGNLT